MTNGERVMHEELERLAREQAALRCELAATAIANARAHAELRRERAELTAWTGLYLDGQAAVQVILGSFPAKARAVNAELGALAAADELAQGMALARRIGRPYLEFTALVYRARREVRWSLVQAAESGMQAIQLAWRHGWADEQAAGTAYLILADVLAWQGRLEEAESWLRRAERTVRPETEPAVGLVVRYIRGMLEMVRGGCADALAALRTAEGLSGRLAAPHYLSMRVPALKLHALVRLGETKRAEQVLAGLGEQDRECGELRIATAALRLAQDDPHAASAALIPVLDGSTPLTRQSWLVSALLLEALARDALGDPSAAGRTVERALDLAEPDRALSAFLIHPAPGLLERHARNCTKHAAMVSEILGLLPAEHEGRGLPGGLEGHGRTGSSLTRGGIPEGHPSGATEPPPWRLIEPLSQSEVRVLRYLPTNLTAPEIARELSVSVTTVRTHISHLFAKLDAHRRSEAVMRARALGLLAPSPRTLH